MNFRSKCCVHGLQPRSQGLPLFTLSNWIHIHLKGFNFLWGPVSLSGSTQYWNSKPKVFVPIEFTAHSSPARFLLLQPFTKRRRAHNPPLNRISPLSYLKLMLFLQSYQQPLYSLPLIWCHMSSPTHLPLQFLLVWFPLIQSLRQMHLVPLFYSLNSQTNLPWSRDQR